MNDSLNKAILVGNLDADPEIRYLQNGKPVCNLSIITRESTRSQDGESIKKTEWHHIVIYPEGLCQIAERYLKKGSKVYLEGQIQTRQIEKNGIMQNATEIILHGFNGSLTILDHKIPQIIH